MNNLRTPLIFLLIGLFASFLSCKDNFEDYSLDKNDVLSFSTDTLSFDTIFSTVNSVTKNFRVYNRNDKPLLISSIEIGGGNQSKFRINVDGMKGTHFQDLRIGANDSLYIFVEVTTNENDENDPIVVYDQISFITNTTKQNVTLEAYSQDAFIWDGKSIDASMTLPNNKPYLIYDSLVVNENVELTIQEGTIFYMHNKANFIVRGNIKAKGTIEKPIVFRGDRSDHITTYITYDNSPKQWGTIFFAKTSFDNEIEYLRLRNGTSGMYFELSDPEKSKLKIKNSVLTNVSSTLFTAFNCNIEAENCEFSNAASDILYLAGGKYSFTQCTMANYFYWSEIKSTYKTLTLTNYLTDTLGNVQALPLVQANFLNTIIYGNGNDASNIKFSPDTIKYPETAFKYMFQNSLLKVKNGANDGNKIIGCTFNKDPKFLLINNKDPRDYIYDFRLDSVSPARDIADPEIASKVPYDLNHISRFLDKGPDMGAYEWISSYGK